MSAVRAPHPETRLYKTDTIPGCPFPLKTVQYQAEGRSGLAFFCQDFSLFEHLSQSVTAWFFKKALVQMSRIRLMHPEETDFTETELVPGSFCSDSAQMRLILCPDGNDAGGAVADQPVSGPMARLLLPLVENCQIMQVCLLSRDWKESRDPLIRRMGRQFCPDGDRDCPVALPAGFQEVSRRLEEEFAALIQARGMMPAPWPADSGLLDDWNQALAKGGFPCQGELRPNHRDPRRAVYTRTMHLEGRPDIREVLQTILTDCARVIVFMREELSFCDGAPDSEFPDFHHLPDLTAGFVFSGPELADETVRLQLQVPDHRGGQELYEHARDIAPDLLRIAVSFRQSRETGFITPETVPAHIPAAI